MNTRPVDAVVVGAGFSGIYMLHRLLRAGYSARLFESGSGLGGTWFHNRYPGARCDIESMDYSYSFDENLQQEWRWSERYASQPELLRYLNHVVDRFALREHIELDTAVVGARFDEDTVRWTVTTDLGDEVGARWCLMATGCLTVAQVPDIPGLDTFEGRWFHTGDWPRDGVDFSGNRVGVIGTGSSGTQLIPIVAEQAAHLDVFQRTANFCMPARNHPMPPEVEVHWKAEYPERRAKARISGFGHSQPQNDNRYRDLTPAQRSAELEARWRSGGLYMMRAFADVLTDPEANEATAEFVRAKIRATVHDPEVSELLCPQGFHFGTKRLCSGTNYYETFNRDDVTLVDVSAAPIEEITPTGLRTASAHHPLDMIVFATGFDAMTGSLSRIDIRGADGTSLASKWSGGPVTYLGLAVSGFPNLFLLTGPGSPSVFSNMVNSAEQHVEWIADFLDHAREHDVYRAEATQEAEDGWVAHVGEVAEATLYPRSPNSWFFGANIPGKPRVFMPYVGGVGNYRARADEVASAGYRGFTLLRR
ncbi:flavin-containing monooxygenase [Pseudonocardia spinosispora]|uniref:flavin-containing monooxygenase n=1 Tax=Pseudonocardia spinosispora TaxID=103441 RepID=UPI002480A93A|nr:NAD(P)/FAD-dependent oxidoreductase [Pseudonocardia spinosispora]